MYQPAWVAGAESGAHQRECAARFDALLPVLRSYRRPFSVFDLGANAGYFSFRIAAAFPQATVIAVDDKKALRKLARSNGLPNLAVIPRRLDGAMLERLGDCERFDVVLAMNVLHHMEDWNPALFALVGMAHRLVVETPGPGDGRAAFPERHGPIRDLLPVGELLARHPSHVTPGADRDMVLIRGDEETALAAQTIDAADRKPPKLAAHTIRRGLVANEIDFDGRGERRAFVPGMNLWNWALLGGCWPVDVAATVRAELARLEAEGRWMDDLRPWNFILSGDGVRAIDIGHKRRKTPEKGGLEKTLAMLAAPEWGAPGR